ncbi:hypothetical protein [Candidatus Sororendozoicomonas aggregata]|uniref:hypothetical protein n=1 Tax=Candidatus Sororendozoicomonas aggregata TaxID=3073239 RepID=UPI002ED56733
MKLLNYYLRLSSKEKKAFSKAVQAELGYLRHLAYNRKKPSHALAKRIELATNGEVRRDELRPDIWGNE